MTDRSSGIGFFFFQQFKIFNFEVDFNTATKCYVTLVEMHAVLWFAIITCNQVLCLLWKNVIVFSFSPLHVLQ